MTKNKVCNESASCTQAQQLHQDDRISVRDFLAGLCFKHLGQELARDQKKHGIYAHGNPGRERGE